mgnify:CR=1 FL=1
MNRALDRDRRSSSQVWLDVVSAVDYLSRGHRPGLTVYDALEEALRWREATDRLFHHYLGGREGRYVITGAATDGEQRFLIARRVEPELLESLAA